MLNVAVLGSGAVGLLYGSFKFSMFDYYAYILLYLQQHNLIGGRLKEAEIYEKAPLHVHFIMRSDYELCSRSGFRIESADGDVNFNPEQLSLYSYDQLFANLSSNPLGRIDWLICALKSTAFGSDESRGNYPILIAGG